MSSSIFKMAVHACQILMGIFPLKIRDGVCTGENERILFRGGRGGPARIRTSSDKRQRSVDRFGHWLVKKANKMFRFD